jgi:hypothetical protein
MSAPLVTAEERCESALDYLRQFEALARRARALAALPVEQQLQLSALLGDAMRVLGAAPAPRVAAVIHLPPRGPRGVA